MQFWLLTPVTTPAALVFAFHADFVVAEIAGRCPVDELVTTNLLPATTLPKLDFSEGIPDDCVTMVAIPTLLLSEEQVHRLIEDLEVRYLGNHDPQYSLRARRPILPDAHQPAPEDNALVALCSSSLAN